MKTSEHFQKAVFSRFLAFHFLDLRSRELSLEFATGVFDIMEFDEIVVVLFY